MNSNFDLFTPTSNQSFKFKIIVSPFRTWIKAIKLIIVLTKILVTPMILPPLYPIYLPKKVIEIEEKKGMVTINNVI